MIDCAIIGGGPAGLTAAIYLGRFHRSPVVFDAGCSRVLQIPLSRNMPGFPDGISGPDLHQRMSRQADAYGRLLVSEQVKRLERIDGGFVLGSASREVRARSVILATGVAVTEPPIVDLQKAIACGALRYCPICDGYETRGKHIAVLASKGASIAEAIFLRTYAEDISLLKAAQTCSLSDEHIAAAQRYGIRVEDRPAQAIALAGEQLQVRFADGEDELFDVIYPCLGSKPRSDLAVSVGAESTPTGGVLVNSHQQTNIPMLYAAGDVLEGLDQIASACGQAAIAATAIHNHLRQR